MKVTTMQVNHLRTVFNQMLGTLRLSAEDCKKAFQELEQVVPDADVKDAMQSGVLLSDSVLSKISQCCEIVGQKPLTVHESLDEDFVKDFRRELAQIRSADARGLFVLAKASQLIHLHMGTEVALLASAQLAGHYRVGTLLEDCLEDKLAFVERTRRLIYKRMPHRHAAA